MAYREFQDSAGVTWTVWDTFPSRPEVMDPEWRSGWLTFQTGAARRRLAPIPPDWTEVSPSRLELMCKAAVPSRRDTPAYGSEWSAGE